MESYCPIIKKDFEDKIQETLTLLKNVQSIYKSQFPQTPQFYEDENLIKHLSSEFVGMSISGENNLEYYYTINNIKVPMRDIKNIRIEFPNGLSEVYTPSALEEYERDGNCTLTLRYPIINMNINGVFVMVKLKEIYDQCKVYIHSFRDLL